MPKSQSRLCKLTTNILIVVYITPDQAANTRYITPMSRVRLFVY